MIRSFSRAVGTARAAVAMPTLSDYSLRALSTAAVAQQVKQKGFFEPSHVDNAVDRFLGGLAKTSYSHHFDEAAAAQHVQGLLIAELRQGMGDAFEYVHESGRSAFYICHNEPHSRLTMVRKMATFVSSSHSEKDSASTCSYVTEDGKLVVYAASFEEFLNPKPAPGERSVDVLCTRSYSAQSSPESKAVAQKLMDQLTKSVFPVYDVAECGGSHIFTMATTVEQTNYIATLNAVILEIEDAVVLRSSSNSFSNGVHVYSFEVRGASAAALGERASLVGLLPNRPFNMMTRLHEAGELSCEQTAFTDAAVIFTTYFTPSPSGEDYVHLKSVVQKEPNGLNRLNSLRLTLSQEMMSERYAGSLIGKYPEFTKMIFDDFRSGTTAERRAKIATLIEHRFKEDQCTSYDLAIFMSFLKFNEVIVKHNFFKTDKAALAFRLNPEFLKDLEYPRVPHGVFLFAGEQWRGFHIRFTDIARGGVRMIISKESTYRKNKRSVFQENYNLAFTQLLKNKDIPEGGSKGTILVSSRYLNKFDEARCKRIFLQYVDGLLDLIIPGEEGVVDSLRQEEILFLGPDENTAGSFPAAGALYSKERGYSAWKSFTTGKDPVLGGIPHDEFGMTTHSVRTYVEGVYEKLGLKQEEMRKFQTGGPDGDLGSNEIKKSQEIMVGLVDGSASLHDPNGVDRVELARLAAARLPLRNFDASKLSKDGFLVSTDARNVTLPDGTVIEDGSRLRDEFHLMKYSDADVFVPCGGRPRSVNLDNVGRFLKVADADGEGMLAGKFDNVTRDQLKFKIIVEGANLFISQDARLALERCGVVLIKDASANKGGVTSSSLEVFAGLSLSDEEHAKYMSVTKDHTPDFYRKYVQEILDRIQQNARMEFEAIWREWTKNPNQPKTLLADALSMKNVQMRANMLSSEIFDDHDLVRYIMSQYAPKTLLEVVPIDTMLERVPLNYQHAICAMWLASRYVYATGVDSNEFDFFRYMTDVSHKVAAAKKSGH